MYSEVEIQCNYSDKNGGIDDASLSINMSADCEETQAWTNEGGGNYSYRCILDSPGTYNITVLAEKSGYNKASNSGEIISRYEERSEIVSLEWENPDSQTIFSTRQKQRYYAPSDLESPLLCVVENNTSTGILSMGITDSIESISTGTKVNEHGVDNEFVLPFSDKSCSDMNSKSQTFIRKGFISSPFSGASEGTKSGYYIIYQSPMQISDRANIGKGKHKIQIRRNGDSIEVIG